MFPTSESLLTLKVLTDIALMSGIILVGLKVLMSPSRNPRQIMELDSALKSLIKEADLAGRDLNEQLLGRQHVLERLLVDLQSGEGRINNLLIKVEEERRLLEQSSQRAEGIKNLLVRQLEEMIIPETPRRAGSRGAHPVSGDSQSETDWAQLSGRPDKSETNLESLRGTQFREGSQGSNQQSQARSSGPKPDQRIETRDEVVEPLFNHPTEAQNTTSSSHLGNSVINPGPSSLRIKTPLMAEIERERIADTHQFASSDTNTPNSQPLASLVERELQQTRSAVMELFSKFEQIESQVSSASTSRESPNVSQQYSSQAQKQEFEGQNVLLTNSAVALPKESAPSQQERNTNINRNDQRLGALGPIKREITVL